MRKYIILSVNGNQDYLYFWPLTSWAWRKFGWEPLVMYQGEKTDLYSLALDTLDKFNEGMTAEMQAHYSQKGLIVDSIDGYRSDTITQVSRLYAACVQDGYLMTGDIDMIPLSDYWQPKENEITVYGHDLTGYTHYPLCYIGMPSTRWVEVMGLTSNDYNTLIKRDLDTLPQAKDPDFYKYWFSDQDLITKRIDETNFPVTHIKRGQLPNGYAVGRVDRGAWTLNHKQYIDAHLFHQMYHKGREQYFEKTLDLLYHIWPNEDFGWLVSYTHKFRELTGHN